MRKITRVRNRPVEPEASSQMREDLLALVRRKVEEHHGVEGYDPVVAIALVATDPALRDPARGGSFIGGTKMQLDAHKEVARYTYPTLKQVEVTGADGGPIEVRGKLADEIVGLLGQLARRPREKRS